LGGREGLEYLHAEVSIIPFLILLISNILPIVASISARLLVALVNVLEHSPARTLGLVAMSGSSVTR
jgi:hypothetical protein